MTAGERWVPVVGWEGLYEVSDLGRVRSLDRTVLNNGTPILHRGRVLRPIRSSTGRLQVGLRDAPRKTMIGIHKLVAAAFLSAPNFDSPQICHIDGDCDNNSASNIYWGTNAQNQRDSVRHGTHNMARRTHCPKGHEYTPENTYVYTTQRASGPGKNRICRACNIARCRERRAKLRGVPA